MELKRQKKQTRRKAKTLDNKMQVKRLFIILMIPHSCARFSDQVTAAGEISEINSFL